MTETTFTMTARKQGRMKYLLLTIVPTLLVMRLIMWLVSVGILPGGEVFGLVYACLSMAGMLVLGYFLIFRKIHTVEVNEYTITDKNWRGKVSEIQVRQIRSLCCNWLKEYLLLDEEGKVLLCVESNMDNRDLFEQWLEIHHITLQDKE